MVVEPINETMRNKGLDILRAIAVILVLFRHSNLEDNFLHHFGWLGVDLFFVLSGFLVSGLLFNEYKKQNTISISRFLIRRGFKIFPPFYFFMFSTLLIYYLFYDRTYSWGIILSEVFYLQSYTPNIWSHTWTLAVEAHFYFLLAVGVLFLWKQRFIERKKLVIGTLLVLLLLSFVMRLYVSYPHRNDDFFSFFQTHLRSDGIIVGVLFSYLYYFTEWTRQLFKKPVITLILSSILIAPGLFFEGGGFFMNTIGLTSVNLGFGLLVIISLSAESYLQKKPLQYLSLPVEFICFIGINSYSIYLWHLNSRKIVYTYLKTDIHLMNVLYILLSLIVGVMMSYLIEKTSLRLRDYLYAK